MELAINPSIRSLDNDVEETRMVLVLVMSFERKGQKTPGTKVQT